MIVMDQAELLAAQNTVAELLSGIRAVYPKIGRPLPKGLTKLRKSELAYALAEARYQLAMQATNAERQDAETVDEVINEELGDVALITSDLAHVITPEMRQAARGLAEVAWGHLQATVHSMGREVRGKVVDAVLRGAGPDGMGRVCVVVQHTEQAEPDRLGNVTWEPTPTYRRTLHRYIDVKFKALAS